MKKTFAIAALFVTALAGTAFAGDNYKLTVSPATAKVNEKAVAKVSVEATGKYHVNKEYPAKLIIDDAGGLTVESTKITKDKAAKLTDKELAFDVGFTATKAGKSEIKATLKFGVCLEDQACEAKTETVVLKVEAK